MNSFNIATFAGDGIGLEITGPCIEVIEAAATRMRGTAYEFGIGFTHLPGGAGCYRETGTALPAPSIEAARSADAILLAAMGLPDVRYPDGTEITPQIDIRMILGLYAGIRPARSVAGVPGPLADPRARNLDFVLIRESTEGLFKEMKQGQLIGDSEARDTLVITRAGTTRVVDYAFRLARQRKAEGHRGIVTCVDKANVFRSFAFFRRVFDEVAAKYPDICAEHAYVDAMALNFVRRPWDYDVLVTENMFGDILSDLAAGLIGGLGMAPSADIGDKHGLFQPCHGTAPDIAGQGKANPLAMFLSGAMMLEWLGQKNGIQGPLLAGKLIRAAIDKALGIDGVNPMEQGGIAGTQAITAAVLANIAALPQEA
jgi:3-isopropylmalate dehydrogenase